MRLEISSHSHPYIARSVETLAEAVEPLVDTAGFWLIDANVAKLHADVLARIPKEKLLLIEASEGEKSFERLGHVFEAVLGARFRRTSNLVVIGGGVLQDIGCFVASVLQRGVNWTLIPTTLLAQCDSCIGSKSSINIASYKNQLGTFYPPHEVILPWDVLRTLPADDLRSGLGEAIKLHLIGGPEHWEKLRGWLGSGPSPELPLAEIIESSLLIKKGFIEEDEFDRGPRRLLNYGHTFAHAYESATGYAVPHGIAVTLGVLSATYFSSRLGLVEEEHFAELRQWLRPYHAPFENHLVSMDTSAVLGAMKLDKKNQTDGITFVLTRGPGKMELMPLGVQDTVVPLLPECLSALAAA